MVEKTSPRQFADHCLCLAIRRAARAVGRRYDEAFQSLGVNNGQFTILMFVSAEQHFTLGELAGELAMDRTTLTAALKPLERDKLIQTRRNPEDARARLITITAKGRALLEKALPLWRQVQRDLVKSAHPLDPSALRKTLSEMV